MERRLWRPATALVCVSGAVFAISQGQLLAPAAPATTAAIAPGNGRKGGPSSPRRAQGVTAMPGPEKG